MKSHRFGILKAGVLVFLLTVSTLLPPLVLADNSDDAFCHEGYDVGPSSAAVVPMEKVTLVDYDPESFVDDYAFLSAVPTAVFHGYDKLFSHPLLFYQDT